MSRKLLVLFTWFIGVSSVPSWADEWYVAPSGMASAAGTRQSPWNLESALTGTRVKPGDTVWILGGTYKHMKRDTGAMGYEVRLAGEEGKPIHVRAASGERVTIDGGLAVLEPSTYVWIWDLELLVSENSTMSRRIEETGSSPSSYGRPWGGLNIYAGRGCKYINLVIHDNSQGVSFWSGAIDSELHGLIIYDNGWDAPDRGHGHAIYTQNETGVKVISDCIMTGGFGYTTHAYGSSRAYVDNYVIEGNICYAAGQFLVGGGRPSHNIRVLKNYLFNVGMQLGYGATQNDDCEVRDNLIVGGGLNINKFQTVVNEGNRVLGQADPRPDESPARVELRRNKYDPNRMNAVIFNWKKSPTVPVLPDSLLKPGDEYRVLNPRDFFGKPVLAGTYDGSALQLPVNGEFAAFVLIRLPAALADEPQIDRPLRNDVTATKKALSTDWPSWRGPNANGVADGTKLPVRWSPAENVRWSVRLPGWGTSSPVVYGNRVFVTSEVIDADKKSLLTLCLDRQNGKEFWRHDFGFGVDQRTHEKSNLAVNTPAVTEDSVYVAFGNADVARYSHDGNLIWVSRYIPRFGDPKMAWGYGLSPVVLDDAVLFPWDHHAGPCFLIGLDKQTGEIAWKKDRPIGTAHATPLLVEHHGQQDILVPGKNRLTAFDARTHAEMWQYGEGEGPYNGEIIVSPVFGDGMVFLQLWRQSPIHAIRLNGDGKPPERVWVSKRAGPLEPSLLYYRGLLYALMDNGALTCFDGKTGIEHYRERLGGACNSSPIAGDGRIYLSNNEGTTFVVKAGTEFELVSTNHLGERITASPAVSGNELIYRTDSHLYCIGNVEYRAR